MKPFIDDYLAGRTPIPCTLCNNFIKFDQFLEMAEGVGAERIATGHYAQHRLESRQRALGDAAQRGSRQGPDVFSVRADAGSACAHDVSAGRIGEAGRCASWRASSAFRPRRSRTARRSASCRTAITRRSSTRIFGSRESLRGETGRRTGHGRWPRWSASTRACIISRWGSGAGWELPRASRLYVISTEPATRRVVIGRERRSAARDDAREGCELDLDRARRRRRCAPK